MRRRPAAGLARAGRQALAAGVDLARRPLLPALRAGPRPPGARREHAVLPVEPRRPPPHRRGAARRPADRRGPRPDRPGLQQLDAPVVRRPRARGRLRDRLRAARTSGCGRAGRRSGATASSGCTASSWPTCYRYVDPERVLVVRYRDLVDEPRRGGRPGQPVPRHPRGTGRLRSRATTRAASCSRAGDRACSGRRCAAGHGSASSRRRRSGVGCTRRSSRLLSDGRDAAPAAARRRAAADGCVAAFADDIDLLSRLTGQDFADWLSAGEPRVLRAARRDGDADQRTQVTRSCAPSGRAAST